MSTRSSQKSWCLIKSPDYRAPSRVEPGLRAVGLDFLHIPLVQMSQLRFRLSVRPEEFVNFGMNGQRVPVLRRSYDNPRRQGGNSGSTKRLRRQAQPSDRIYRDNS
jgi:hypothetical protein